MKSAFIKLGFNNVVIADRIIAVVSASAAPIKRLKDAAKQSGRMIDATNGRKTRAVIITDSNHIILSSAQPETILERMKGKTR